MTDPARPSAGFEGQGAGIGLQPLNMPLRVEKPAVSRFRGFDQALDGDGETYYSMLNRM